MSATTVSPPMAPRAPLTGIALYARASTQRQAQAQSVEQQLERLQAYAEAQGWRVVPDDVFRDDGYSGATLRRPGLDRRRDHAAGARLDRVLITAPDRLARNFVHQALLVEELERHGAVVEFLDRPMSQDPHDRLLLQIRGAVAEYERTLITDRMRRGRLRKLRAGLLLPWTQPPYGYRLAPDRPRDPAGVRLDEVEAAVVRDLFAWCVEEGLPLSAIVHRLHALGVRSPRGCAYWSRSAVRGVLTNPIYVGQVYANRMRTGRSARRHSALRPVGRRGETKLRTTPAEWIAVARVPAVVNRAHFDAAQARLALNQRTARRNAREDRYLLRGLVSCGQCRRSCAGAAAAGGTARASTTTTSAARSRRCATSCAARGAARGTCPRASSTPSSGATCVRSCSTRRWSPRRWRAPAAATGCRKSSKPGARICAAGGRASPSSSSASRRRTSAVHSGWRSTGVAELTWRAGWVR